LVYQPPANQNSAAGGANASGGAAAADDPDALDDEDEIDGTSLNQTSFIYLYVDHFFFEKTSFCGGRCIFCIC